MKIPKALRDPRFIELVERDVAVHACFLMYSRGELTLKESLVEMVIELARERTVYFSELLKMSQREPIKIIVEEN